MRWRFWRTREELTSEVLGYLLKHGETRGRFIIEATKLRWAGGYAFLYRLEDEGLIRARPWLDDPLLLDPWWQKIRGGYRYLYSLTDSGRRRLIELEHASDDKLVRVMVWPT